MATPMNNDWNVFPKGKTVALSGGIARVSVEAPTIVQYGHTKLNCVAVLVQNRPITWGQVRSEMAR